MLCWNCTLLDRCNISLALNPGFSPLKFDLRKINELIDPHRASKKKLPVRTRSLFSINGWRTFDIKAPINPLEKASLITQIYGQYLCLGLSLLQLVMPVMGTETMVMDPQMDWDVLCVEWDLMLHRETTLVHHAAPTLTLVETQQLFQSLNVVSSRDKLLFSHESNQFNVSKKTKFLRGNLQ